MLTERRADILSLLVNDYIDTATPVSSRALAGRHQLELSAATIRNELAALEEEGYITHPYTSAGRVPSDRGYRLYVESLMAEEPVAARERRTVEHQFHQVSAGLDEWLGLAAGVLAGWLGNVAVITRPRGPVARLKHVQLVHLRDDAALLVAVMDDGRVQQRTLALRVRAGQPELTARAARLNDRCAGRGAAVARSAAAELAEDDDREAASVLAELIEEHQAGEGAYLEGLQSVLEQPEFASSDRMLEAVRHLVAYELYRTLSPTADIEPGSMRVMIGDENADPWMREWSMVISAFGDRHGTAGTVAVLGPTRMSYARTIPRVRYLATLMSELMDEVVA